jgi:hypothetical protein
MKKITFLLAIIATIGSADVFAQQTSSATANTSATIIAPIAITKTADLEFGNVAVSGTTAGTVILSPAGSRTTTGGVTLPATTGTVNAAAFNVTGANNYTYTITLPSSVTLQKAADEMTVNTFTSNPLANAGQLNGSGAQTVTVGATLNVAAAQPVGTYQSDNDFQVTVNYN